MYSVPDKLYSINHKKFITITEKKLFLPIFLHNLLVRSLVVEQPCALLDKRNTQLFSRLEDRAVVLATAGGRDVFSSGAGSTEDVVDEGELVHTY